MEEDEHKLPCDVVIGAITFRKGCKLSTLTNRARAWFEISKTSAPDHTKQSQIIRTICTEK